MRHGHGVHIVYDDNGQIVGRFEGEYKEGNLDGYACQDVYINNVLSATYRGHFKMGSLSHGTFEVTVPNKWKRYTGDFMNVDYHGDGLIEFSNGNSFKGKFAVSLMSGIQFPCLCSVLFVTIILYMVGPGTVTLANGDRFDCLMKNDAMVSVLSLIHI